MTYAEKLKDPRWQKKRLEVLTRDGWKCTNCHNSKENLHVHHLSYIWDKNPWEYHLSNFKTLCKSCHEEEEMYKSRFNSLVYDLQTMGFLYSDFESALLIMYHKVKKLKNGNI